MIVNENENEDHHNLNLNQLPASDEIFTHSSLLERQSARKKKHNVKKVNTPIPTGLKKKDKRPNPMELETSPPLFCFIEIGIAPILKRQFENRCHAG